MIIIETFILAVANILDTLIGLYVWVIIAQALVSWLPIDQHHPVVQILHRLSAPAYNLVRKYIPTTFSMIDFTPLILILGLQFINLFVVKLLFSLVNNL